MKKQILILIVLFCTLKTNAQDLTLTFKQNIDSLDLWEFNFVKVIDAKDKKLGSLILKRKELIQNDDKTKSISPKIELDIYPLSCLDSISNLESGRTIHLSCCYPRCGATIITTKDFVFWSDPFSITCAFYCNGIDYTRKNAEVIIEEVKNKTYKSIEELINELPIDRIKN